MPGFNLFNRYANSQNYHTLHKMLTSLLQKKLYRGKSTLIGVREGILLGGRKKFALKITISPKNRQLALKLTF